MIDKEKIKAIIKQYADRGERLYNESYNAKKDSQAISYWDGYRDCANLLLRELEDMQKEPVSEKLEKLKKLADAMYYAAQYLTTDASRLHKAMDEYHKFIIHEYKEEPVSVKECMYSKDNYTDEDRKALCDGCEEECKYGKLNTMLDDALSKETKESWNKRLDEDSESKGIKEAYKSYTDSRLVLLRPDIADMSCDRDTKMSFDVFDGSELEAAFYEGAKWQKEQILDCNTTLQRAFELGKQEMKQQMMKDAVDGKIYETQARSKLKATTTGKISGLKYRAGDEVKIIIIKEE